MSHRLISIFMLSAGALCAQAQPTYPVISKAEQKLRDDDSRPLLEAELTAERNALAKAQSASSTATAIEREAAVHRHQENIKALQRELEVNDNRLAVPKQERLVVKAVRPTRDAADSKRPLNFWDPYNRAPDSADFFTSPKEGQP